LKESIVFTLFIFLLLGCASIQPLDGGDKDVTPPVVLNSYPDSASLNVTGTEFSFEFDEYIKLKNPNNLFIISPSQKNNPDFKIKGKKLFITLNDSILPLTTYSFQFNGGVVDLNESNPLQDYQYIYSTGPYLDSLQLKFKVLNYQTKKPCSKCKIQLYYTGKDSAILNAKPAYVGFTNDLGYVQLNNLSDTTFYAYAILDENNNFTLEAEELISLQKPITTSLNDTSYTISVFPYQPKISKPKLLRTRSKTIASFLLSTPVYNNIYAYINDSLITSTYNGKDSLFTNYGFITDTASLTLVVCRDTFKYQILPSKSYRHQIKSVTRTDFGFQFISNNLIESLQSHQIKFSIDSIGYTSDSISFYNNFLNLYTTKQGTNYSFYLHDTLFSKDTVLPSRSDTINYSTQNKVSLSVTLEGFHSKLPKIVNLKQNGKTLQSYKTTSNSLVIYDLNPGKYALSVAEDINRNSLWDTGNPLLNQIPEPIQLSEDFELRLNWDNHFTIKKL
jgi:hypothetical protein